MVCDKERWCVCVCDKVMCERWCVWKLCLKESMWQSCVWKMVCDKVVCERWCGERWCVTKLCVKDDGWQSGVWQLCVWKMVWRKMVLTKWCVKDGVWQSRVWKMVCHGFHGWEPSAPPEPAQCHKRHATQSDDPCRQVPHLPRKVKVNVAKCHAATRASPVP